MTEQITNDSLDRFRTLTSYDIGVFFKNYIEFIDTYYSNIINFFSGSSDIVPTLSFSKLDWLLKEYKKIIDVIILNANSLDNYEFWALTEYIEDIGHAIEAADNTSKWLRSSSTKNGYKQQIISEQMTSQGQGLEDLERKVLRSSNPNDTWVNTALENELREEDYTLDGGYLIKVIYKNNAALSLNSVVDNIDVPEKTYGLDIDQNILFTNDDLVVLSYKDTLLQCASILTALKREDDPSFPERGLNVKTLIGSNVAAISYPIIFRDLAANFATDDSFKSFSITDVRRDKDAILLDFTVQTKAGDSFNDSVQL